MDELKHFKIADNHAAYRPVGEASLNQIAELVNSAIAFARENEVRKLMVVLLGITSLPSPSVAERYLFVRKWAETSRGHVQLALVVRSEMIDSRKFSNTVASNCCFSYNVFPSETAALVWLLSNS